MGLKLECVSINLQDTPPFRFAQSGQDAVIRDAELPGAPRAEESSREAESEI